MGQVLTEIQSYEVCMKKLLLVSFVLFSCGKETVVKQEYLDPPKKPPVDNVDEFSYQDFRSAIDTYCIGCHQNSNFIKSEQDLRNSQVYEQLFNDNMPPEGARQLPEELKDEMLNFLG